MSIGMRRLRRVVSLLHALRVGAVATGVVAVAGCGGGGTEPAVRPDPRGTREEALTLATPTGALAGTLVLPAGPGPFPAAILVSGSGPTDRDGNSRDGARVALRNDALKLLAEGLAARGVATLRFDKRGVGASAGAVTSEADLPASATSSRTCAACARASGRMPGSGPWRSQGTARAPCSP